MTPDPDPEVVLAYVAAVVAEHGDERSAVFARWVSEFQASPDASFDEIAGLAPPPADDPIMVRRRIAERDAFIREIGRRLSSELSTCQRARLLRQEIQRRHLPHWRRHGFGEIPAQRSLRRILSR